jgi:hypothetical protein
LWASSPRVAPDGIGRAAFRTSRLNLDEPRPLLSAGRSPPRVEVSPLEAHHAIRLALLERDTFAGSQAAKLSLGDVEKSRRLG